MQVHFDKSAHCCNALSARDGFDFFTPGAGFNDCSFWGMDAPESLPSGGHIGYVYDSGVECVVTGFGVQRGY
jgi:hypothetical protein